jgi:polyisoprenoid-binding protein YceI
VEAVEGMTARAAMTVSPGRIRARFCLALFASLAALCLSPAARAQEVAVQLDPVQSKIDFTLGSSLHTVEGTFKLKSGAIRFDPSSGKISGSIIVDATSGESGNGGRDRKMHREILESGKYPEITFTPQNVKGTFNPNGPSMVEASGRFSLHGQDHEVTLAIEVQPAGRQLQMAAHFTIPYIKWGLKNPSTFILRASDKVEIDIQAVGRLVGDEGPR